MFILDNRYAKFEYGGNIIEHAQHAFTHPLWPHPKRFTCKRLILAIFLHANGVSKHKPGLGNTKTHP